MLQYIICLICYSIFYLTSCTEADNVYKHIHHCSSLLESKPDGVTGTSSLSASSLREEGLQAAGKRLDFSNSVILKILIRNCWDTSDRGPIIWMFPGSYCSFSCIASMRPCSEGSSVPWLVREPGPSPGESSAHWEAAHISLRWSGGSIDGAGETFWGLNWSAEESNTSPHLLPFCLGFVPS